MANTLDHSQLCKLKRYKTIEGKDRISDLPDDILTNILARLTFKEAIATSTLSKRWIDVWTSYPFLDFGFCEDIYYPKDVVDIVKKIMKKFNGGKLHRFKVVHWMPKKFKYVIDNWISFAIQSHVSELELDFKGEFQGNEGNYYVPLHVLARENIVRSFVSLRDLRLTSVDFLDEVFDMLLRNCTSLEIFYLKHNFRLVNAKTSAPHLKLKSLMICHYYDLEKLELSAPNLVSFKYNGLQNRICINDAQQPVSLSLDENSIDPIFPRRQDFLFNQFSSYLPKLESLSLVAALFVDMSDFTELCVFRNLRTLALASNYSSSIRLCCQVGAFIISAAPYLERLELDLISSDLASGELELPFMSTHKNLKEIKVSGFNPDEHAMEFLVYLIERSVSLQKIELNAIYTLLSDDPEVSHP